ncbi:hypothetical protein [Niveispirillum irakense]|uniref:hypothetical protein n=1 Tax=Niveispirillum irakense TaxID=34011 RepID=UPI000420B7A2|nr:hypothetical protein [Niveispirillum irakense]
MNDMMASAPPNPWRHRLLTGAILLLLALVAALGWVDRLEKALLPQTLAARGEQVLEENFTRAAALFATARAVDAAISVAQSTQVSAGVGLQGGVSPGQALDPINDLVERFGAVMLTATVALGGAQLLVQAGDGFGLTVLLPAGLVLVVLALWVPGGAGRAGRRAGMLLVWAALLAKIGLPLTVLGTEMVADALVTPRIEAADARLAALNLPSVPEAGEGEGWLDRLRSYGDAAAQLSKAFAVAGDLADIVIDLTIAYIVKIVVLPLLTLWLVARLADLALSATLPQRWVGRE